MKKLIAIYGPGDVTTNDELYCDALLVGKLLGSAGFNVVTGGYGGVMEAASRGAKEAGGGVVAVTAEVYSARGVQTNSFVAKEIKVKSAVDRLMELIDLPDAAIAVGASPGTLLEVLTVWDYAKKRFLPAKPIILVGKDWSALLAAFDNVSGLRGYQSHLTFSESPEDAVAALVEYFGPMLNVPEMTVLNNE